MSFPRFSRTSSDRWTPIALKIPARRAESTLRGDAHSPVPAEPEQAGGPVETAWRLGRRAERRVMIEDGMTVRMTEADVARDLPAVLEKVRQGVEVLIEQDSRPVAVIEAPPVRGRNISEVIAALEARGANAVIDEDFARDVEEGIKAHRAPWNPPSWG